MMNATTTRRTLQTVLFLLAFSCAAGVWAQEPKAAAPKARAPAASKPATEEESPPADAATAAILATKPTTPAECVRAARNLADLGHPDVAKRFLKQTLDAKLTAEQLAELGSEFGVALFLDLANRPALLPEAKQLADAVLPAFKAQLGDAKRIEALVQQLQDVDPEKRVQAMAALQTAGRAAVCPLIAVLADPARAAEHENVRTVLAGMGRAARNPLAAVIDVADPKLTVQAILTLAEMGSSKAVVDLLRPCLSESSDATVRAAAAAALKRLTGGVPTRPQAVRMLSDAAKNYFDRRTAIEDVADGKAEIWRWDADKRACVAQSGTPADASRAVAARLARDAFVLAPNDSKICLLHLAATLDAAAYANGLDRPLDDKNRAVAEAKSFGPKAIDEVLGYAMAEGHPAAATAAARLLGEIGSAGEVLYQGDKPSPLVRAVQHADQRLRMAALKAIVRLQPSRPYAGSSYVPAALGYFAASSGMRHALIGGANVEQSRDMAGMLAAAGFQTDTASTGQELVRLASRSPDYEMAWIDVSINHPEINTLLQELRHDPRTALLRVGLVGRSGFVPLAEHLAEHDAMAKGFARPHDEQAFRWQLDQLATLAPQEFVDFNTRQRQAAESLDLLDELFRTSSKLYDLRRVQDAVLVALHNPKLATKAVALLAQLNSPESQRALASVAGRFTQPLALRQAAAKAFCENIQKHGILLTTDEIREQYHRYNESEKQDAATQHVLRLIVDCLEAPTAGQIKDQRPAAGG